MGKRSAAFDTPVQVVRESTFRRYPGRVTGKHQAAESPYRKATLAVMCVGTVVLAAMAFGPLWMVRAALGLAIAMALASVLLAWREVEHVTKAHQLELKAVLAASREQAERRHRESLEMIDRFVERSTQLSANVQRITAELGAAHAELATMRGNSVWLRGEVAERQARIDELNQRIAELESQAEVAEAEVLALPRYGTASSRALPSAEEIWADGNHPTVVDLNAITFPVLDERKHA